MGGSADATTRTGSANIGRRASGLPASLCSEEPGNVLIKDSAPGRLSVGQVGFGARHRPGGWRLAIIQVRSRRSGDRWAQDINATQLVQPLAIRTVRIETMYTIG